MELFLIRHGESESNANLSESKDSILTPLGHQQARLAAEALRGAEIEQLFCSPQKRALQTASYVVEALNLPPYVWPELAERDLCADELGLPRSEMRQKFPAARLPDSVDEQGWARHWRGEEAWPQLVSRITSVAERVRSWQRDEHAKRVAFIIHGTSGSALISALFNVPIEPSVRFSHENCGITHLILDSERILMKKLNDTSHLQCQP